MIVSQGVLRKVGTGAALIALVLFTGCAGSRYERSTGEFVDDQMLNHRVDHALNAQPVYKFPDVHVHSYRGVVQLSGFVATEQQRTAAAEIARYVRGVAQVENAISVAPLPDTTVQSFIPGRETSNFTRDAGAPVRDTGVQRGAMSSTNNMNHNREVFR